MLHMLCRWKSSYIEDGRDPINVCSYMCCRWRSSYIEGIVGIPLTFVYICFAVGDPVNPFYITGYPTGNIYKQTLMGSQPSLLYNRFSNDKTYINER
jgi:hypothetical protein